jgi:hypothetical protein
MVLRSPVLTVLLAVSAALVFTHTADARRPVVAYVDQGKQLHLYDTQTAAEVPAPPLTINDPFRGFAMSLNGRFLAYTDAAKKVHLYDRADASDKVVDGVEGTPRSVSDAGTFATDGADNGPARVYAANGTPIATGLDNAAGTNKHRQSRISADGRFLATTCNSAADCIADSGGDSDLYIQDLGTMKDTAFADDALTGTAGKDDEHPCIDADGSLVGADVNVGANNHDIAVYDRTAGKALDLSGINKPGTDLGFCALDATGDYIGFGDVATGAASVYERSSGTLLALPPNVVVTPIWLTQPYERPVAKPAPKPDSAKVLSKLRAKAAATRKGPQVTIRFTMARRLFATVAIGRVTKGRFRSLVSKTVRANKGANTVTLRSKKLAPGVYTVRVTSEKDAKTVSVRVR